MYGGLTNDGRKQMSRIALKVNTDGKVFQIDLGGDTLAALQAGVGGWVQAVDINPHLTMWVNEEGKLMDLPHNMFAQRLWNKVYGATDYIVGDIVLTGGVGKDGETQGLDPKDAAAIKMLIAL